MYIIYMYAIHVHYIRIVYIFRELCTIRVYYTFLLRVVYYTVQYACTYAITLLTHDVLCFPRTGIFLTTHNYTHQIPISAGERLEIKLRILATGDSQQTVAIAKAWL